MALAQDLPFSQFYASSLFLNPAYAGASDAISLTVNYRQQPQNINVTNNLQQVSALMPIYKGSVSENKLGGFGITLFNQAQGPAGTLKTQGAMLSLAKTFHFDLFGPEFFVVGVQGGMTRKSIDLDGLLWGSMNTPFLPEGFDPTLPNPGAQFEDNVTTPFINAGILYQFNPKRDYLLYSASYFSGITVNNISRPNQSFTSTNPYKAPILLKYHGGFEFVLNPQFRVSPNVILTYQSTSLQANIGGYVSYDFQAGDVQNFDDNLMIVGGIWYRLRDSFIFLVGISRQRYRIGISYDLNKLSGNNQRNETLQQAFELSLNFVLKTRQTSGRFSNPLF